MSSVQAERGDLQKAVDECSKSNPDLCYSSSAETDALFASPTPSRNEEKERLAGNNERLRDQLQES